ncbi:MAG TPA: hypothetical protein VFM55_03265 [Micromonosporaceae bacterium]|nr:hypothetical protein [Micromonosporaceae bacterium]
MWSLLVLGYLTAVVMAFVGAALLPRVRWLLLVLGTIGIVLPVAAMVVLVAYVATSDIQFG